MSDKVQIHVRVSKRTRQRLKLMADDDGTSLMAIAEALIEQALEKEGAIRKGKTASLGERSRATRWHSVAPGPIHRPVFDFEDL